jgi:hypothetical protein
MTLNGAPAFVILAESEEVPRYMDTKAEKLIETIYVSSHSIMQS